MAEFTIVGAGLAGTALAWALHRRGRSVRLLDREPPTTTSRVAAGLLTPITGKKPAVSWRWAELRPFAERMYREVEAATGEKCFHERPVMRLFTSAAEREAFGKMAFTGLVTGGDGALMTDAAQLDTVAYLNASREWFRHRGMYERGEWDGRTEMPTVLCQGYVSSGAFPLPFRPAKGEILTLRIPGFNEQRVLNRGGWWLSPTNNLGQVSNSPSEEDKLDTCPTCYRFGATYSWDRLDDEPSEAGRVELTAKLREFTAMPFEVVGHTAGVRPILPGQKPVIGTHPTIPGLAVFNGLSSKGALTAPFFADMLAAHLCDGTPIDPEVDVRNRTHP